MQRLKILGLAALAVFAFSAIAASEAQAEGPFWQLCAKEGSGKTRYIDSLCTKESSTGEFTLNRLIKPKTKPLEAEAKTNLVLTATGFKITCEALKLKEAEIIGTEKGTAGTGKGIVVFEKCKVEGNGEGCKVTNETITTEPVIATLDKENKTSVKGEKYLGSVRPAKGAVFGKLEFEGAKCTLKETVIELAAGAKLGAATTLENCNKVPVELKVPATEILCVNNLLKAPATLLKKEFEENGGAVEEVKEGLVAFGKAITKVEGSVKGFLIGASKGGAWGAFGVER